MKYPLFIVCILFTISISAQPAPSTTRLLIGGGYDQTYAGFIRAVLPHAGDERVYIVIIPTAFSYDSQTLSARDLLLHNRDADMRRRELETVCNTLADVPCVVMVAPIYTRALADEATIADYLPDDLAGVYLLGGDTLMAMRILADTTLERLLDEAYQRGIPIGGTGGSMAIMGHTPIISYADASFSPSNALHTGAVTLWEARGVPFASHMVMLESFIWERARLPRLLNAIAHPATPNIGIGIDAGAGGVLVDDASFGAMFGTSTAIILDAQTFASADNATFGTMSGTLAMRDVVVHLLTEGHFSYHLPTRTVNIAMSLLEGGVNYGGFTLREGAGRLILGGRIFGIFTGAEAQVLGRLVAFAGGASARLHLIAIGYEDDNRANATLDQYRNALLTLAPSLTITQTIVTDADFVADETPDGAIIIGHDTSHFDASRLALLTEWHLAGVPMLFDDEAVAIAGRYYIATPHTDPIAPFRVGEMPMATGLGLLDVTLQPRLMDDNRYGRWLALAYTYPDLTAIGIADDTALFISHTDRQVLGMNGVFALDLRHATLDSGGNGHMVIANGLLDVLTVGDELR